jgi:hypothetical protein
MEDCGGAVLHRNNAAVFLLLTGSLQVQLLIKAQRGADGSMTLLRLMAFSHAANGGRDPALMKSPKLALKRVKMNDFPALWGGMPRWRGMEFVR